MTNLFLASRSASKAYIPLRRKNICVGLLHLAISPTREFFVGETSMLVSKNAKICVSPNANSKICVTPTQTTNASQWNIVCVGSPGVGSRVGHVHFIFFVFISFALGSQFPVEYGLNSFYSCCNAGMQKY